MTITAETGPAGVTIPETFVFSIRSEEIGVAFHVEFTSKSWGLTVEVSEQYDGLDPRELSGGNWTSAGIELDDWSAKKVPPRVAAMLVEKARAEFARLDAMLLEQYMQACRACIVTDFVVPRYSFEFSPLEDARHASLAALIAFRRRYLPAPKDPVQEALVDECVALATEGPAAKPEPVAALLGEALREPVTSLACFTVKSTLDEGVIAESVTFEEALSWQNVWQAKEGKRPCIIDERDDKPACMKSVGLGCECHRCVPAVITDEHNHFGEVIRPDTCPACAAIAAGDTSGEVPPT